jgi:hypothetical protein
MHHTTPHRGRSHTQKQNRYKPKINSNERQKRQEYKKLIKIFSSWKALHPICYNLVAKAHSAPLGVECRGKSNNAKRHFESFTKSAPFTQWGNRRAQG